MFCSGQGLEEGYFSAKFHYRPPKILAIALPIPKFYKVFQCNASTKNTKGESTIKKLEIITSASNYGKINQNLQHQPTKMSNVESQNGLAQQ